MRRFPSCVLYIIHDGRDVSLCISELAHGLIEVRAAGASDPWPWQLTRAETAEAAALLERDRAMLSGAMLVAEAA